MSTSNPRGLTPIFPTSFLIGICALVTGALLLAATHQSNTNAALDQALQHAEPVKLRHLRFVDHHNGDIGIIDADDGATLETLTTGEGGFMRSVMRGLARVRRAEGFDAKTPFELTLWPDGLVLLRDPTTDRQIALSAFGIDNVRAFSRLL